MQKISLNGDWRLTYTTLGKKEEAWGRWIPAVVPGDIHLDLMREGLICEPLIGLNSTRYRWIEEKDWWYRRRFTIEDLFIGKKMELVCDGLDLTADIWLNGEKVGSANNMFRQHRYDVTHHLKTGLNELLVRLDVGFEAVKGAPTEKFAKAWRSGRTAPALDAQSATGVLLGCRAAAGHLRHLAGYIHRKLLLRHFARCPCDQRDAGVWCPGKRGGRGRIA